MTLPSSVGRRARRFLHRGSGRLPRGPLQSRPAGRWDYPSWLEARREARGRHLTQATPGLFSILTCVYDGSPADLFRRTAASVRAQQSPAFEWVVVAQGPIPDGLALALREEASDPRVRLLLKPDNAGIIRGLRAATEAATGVYVLPLDGDDRLLPDTLSVLAGEIERRGRPPFVYGDEDALVDETPAAPFFRPDWDPLLNFASSYIWHPSAFDRLTALRLGVFTDTGSEFCQDWDTVTRFAAAGIEPVHVAEVLYHWTAHDASSTNRADPHRESLSSQRNALERALEARSLGDVFRLEEFPLDRGLPELWPRRRRRDPPDVTLVIAGENAGRAARVLAASEGGRDLPPHVLVTLGAPILSARARRAMTARWTQSGAAAPDIVCMPGFGIPALRRAVDACPGDWTVVLESGVVPDRPEWLWEAVGIGDLVPDVGFVSARIVDGAGIVRGGGELWGMGDPLGCPDAGYRVDDPGPYAISLKPHCVSAVNEGFFIARTAILTEALSAVPDEADPRWLGVWLAMWAERAGVRTAYSPLVCARTARRGGMTGVMAEAERQAVVRRFGDIPAQHPLARLYRLVGARGGR